MDSENNLQTDAPEGSGNADEGSQMQTLSELLEIPSDDAPEGGDQLDGAASGNADKNAKPEMFNDLAEAMGIELDDLYKLKVSTTEGKTVTIEDMKALQATQDDVTIRELEFEESRAKTEGQLRQAQNELAEIVGALPEGSVKPEVLEKIRAKNVARVEAEKAKTMEAIPSWSDENTRTKEIGGMAEHLKSFGFPADYLGSVTDHRQLLFIRESYLREQRISRALEKVKAGKPKPVSATKAPAPVKRKAGQLKPKNSNTRNGLEAFFSDV